MRCWGEEKEADRMKQPQLWKEQMLARKEGERGIGEEDREDQGPANVRNVEALGKGYTYWGQVGSVYIKTRITNAFLNASQIVKDPR